MKSVCWTLTHNCGHVHSNFLQFKKFSTCKGVWCMVGSKEVQNSNLHENVQSEKTFFEALGLREARA